MSLITGAVKSEPLWTSWRSNQNCAVLRYMRWYLVRGLHAVDNRPRRTTILPPQRKNAQEPHANPKQGSDVPSPICPAARSPGRPRYDVAAVGEVRPHSHVDR